MSVCGLPWALVARAVSCDWHSVSRSTSLLTHTLSHTPYTNTLALSSCTQQGKPSRSLQAAYKLIDEAGLTADDVVHLERGLYGWYQASLPIAGE